MQRSLRGARVVSSNLAESNLAGQSILRLFRPIIVAGILVGVL
jgi:hypothetical protein